jgi:hypothetical protein
LELRKHQKCHEMFDMTEHHQHSGSPEARHVLFLGIVIGIVIGMELCWESKSGAENQRAENMIEEPIYGGRKHAHKSLYSLIRDFFMIWRLIKDDIMFGAWFDYDIDVYYI